MSDTVQIRVWIETDNVGSICECTLEFDRDDWESMSEKEQEQQCKEAALDMGAWGYSAIEVAKND